MDKLFSGFIYRSTNIFTGYIVLQCIFLLVLSGQSYGQYNPGKLAVVVVGDGTSYASGTACPVFIREFNTSGTGQAGTLRTTFPTTAVAGTGAVNRALTQNFSAASEGFINLSVNRQSLTLVGYNTSSGTGSVSSLAATSFPTNTRVVGKVGVSGTPDTRTTLFTAYSSNVIRSATTSTGTAYWIGGAGGVAYTTDANVSTDATILNTINTRGIGIFNNQLYTSANTGTTRLATVGSGLPTTIGQTVTNLSGFTNSTTDPYAFVFLNTDGTAGPDVVYMASLNASPTGIVKYTSSDQGLTWTAKGVLTGNAFSVAAVYNSCTGSADLYITSSTSGTAKPTFLYKYTDNSATTSTLSLAISSGILLATPATNTTFGGVSFTPTSTLVAPAAFSVTGTGSYCAGGSGLAVGLSGSETGVNYQLFNGASTVGSAVAGTGSSISFGNQTTGTYTVVATNVLSGCTTNMTGNAVVTVNPATTISGNPGSLTVCAGAPASFSVTAAGTGTLTYQWRKNTVNIGGATSSGYNIPVTAAVNAGSYDVIVTGTCGTATSTTATLTVNAITAISGNPSGLTVCAGASASFSVTASGAGTLGYQWRKNTVAISGATSSGYSIPITATTDAGSYDVVVTGTCGTATSTAATLTVNAATIVTANPVPVTVCAGAAASFSVTATGTGTLTYQWRKNTANISGASNPTYNIPATVVADAGSYDVVVTGTCGTATSTAAALIVNAVTSISVNPAPLTVCVGSAASFSVTAAGSGITYQWRKNTVNISGAINDSYNIPVTSLTDAGSYDVVVTGTCGTVTSTAAALTVKAIMAGIYTIGTGQAYTTLTAAVNAYNNACLNGAVVFQLTDATYPSETYPIAINQNPQASAINTLTIKPAPGVTASVSGTSASGYMIRLLGNYITIDGSNASNGTTRDLTITNTSTNPGVLLIGSAGLVPVMNVSVKNCSIINGSTSNSALIISDAAIPGDAGYFNNITIQNNSIQKTYIGIFSTAEPGPGNGSGLLITANDLNTGGTNRVRLVGIYVEGSDGVIVSNNQIGNSSNTIDPSNITGIWLATDVRNAAVLSNTISSISGSLTAPRGIFVTSGITAANINLSGNTIAGLTSSSANSIYGIVVAANATSGVTIQKNIISNIKNTNPGGYGARGIYLGSTAANAATNIYNNFVSDVAGYGYNESEPSRNGIGILVDGDGYNIYHNTVSMATNQTLTTSTTAAIKISAAATIASSVNLRNNIFSNTQTVGNNRYSIYCGANSNVFANIDYNDYDAGSAPNLGFLGTNQQTLSAWKAATIKDFYSVNVAPSFVSASDLHLVETDAANNFLYKTGVAIAEVSTDIDNTNRYAPPDIGADEFILRAPPACAANLLPVNGANGACNGQKLFWVEAGNGNTEGYRLSFGTNAPDYNNIANNVDLGNVFVYNTGSLLQGITYGWRLMPYNTFGQNYCTVQTFTVPSFTVSISNTSCPGGTSAQLTSNPVSGAAATISNYQWSLNGASISGAVNAIYTATAAGSYTVTVTNSFGCTATSAPFIITAFSTALTGIYTINSSLPASCSNFISLASAINVLNTNGVSGNTVFNIASGHTETAPAGGLVINYCALNASLKPAATRTVSFMGGTVAAVITAPVGTSTTTDGIIKLVGADYISFDKINVQESAGNPDATTQMEWGYALLKCDGNNGSNHNVISNCSITLNKTNTSSTGIYSGNHIATSTTGLNYSGITGDEAQVDSSRNGTNIFRGNSIQNVYRGISLNGNANLSGVKSLNDSLNFIGITGTGNGNTITDFGGGSVAVNAIIETNQRGFRVRNNNINGGTGSTGTLTGISMLSGAWGEVIDNTISLAPATTTSATTGITVTFTAGGGVNPNLVTITGNTVQNFSNTAATSASFTAITSGSGGTGSILDISNNSVQNNSLTGTGTFTAIANTGTPAMLTMNGNSMTGNNKSSTGTWTGLSFGSPGNGSINNNTVSNNEVAGGSASVTMNCTTGSGSSSSVYTFSQNIISNNRVLGMAGSSAATLSGYTNSGSSLNETISNNNIDNLYIGGAATPSTGVQVIRGINNNIVSTTTRNVSGNSITNLHSDANLSAGITGIISNAGGTVNMFNNRIYNLFPGQNGTSAAFAKGISIQSGTSVTAYNNLIGLDLSQAQAPAANAVLATNDAVKGIEVTGGTAVKLYFNTIRLAGNGTGSAFGSSGIGLTSTTPAVDIRNNIVENLIPGGGLAMANSSVAFRRTATVAANATGYSPSSNNNLWFVSGSNTNIYFDGSNVYNDLAAFKTQVTGRETNSRTENVGFQSTTGTDAGFLKVNLSSPTLIESAAQPISGITTDYFATVRNVVLPDIGAHEAGFVNATAVITAVSANLTTPQCVATARMITALVTQGSNPVTVTLNYSYGPVAQSPVTMTGGPTSYTATLPAAPPNTQVTWYVTVTDAASTASFAGPSYKDAYLAGVTIAASANQSSVCSGSPVILSGLISEPTSAAPAAASYCASLHTNGCLNDDITNVSLNTLNNPTSGCGGTSHYTYFNGGGTQTTTLTPTVPQSLAVSFGSNSNQYFGAWIDYDHNGSYDASEFLGASANAGANGTIAVSFTVPLTAANGLTHLRIVGGNDNPVTATQACGISSDTWGETQDYDITINGTTAAFALPVTYTWKNAANTVVGTATNPTTINPTFSSSYRLTITDSRGCSVVSTASNTVTVNTLAITTNLLSIVVCEGNTASFTVTATGASSYQWRKDIVDIPGATNPLYSIAATTAADAGNYDVVVTGATCSVTSTAATLTVNPVPSISNPVAATRCGYGTVQLAATPSAGASISWFGSAAGVDHLGTGNSFTTPQINTTTTFYAEAYLVTATEQSNLGYTAIPPNNNGWYSQRGIVFNATSAFTLISAQYYSTSTNVTNMVHVVLQDNSGTQLRTVTLAIVQGASPGWYTMDLNWLIPTGSGYRLLAEFNNAVNRIPSGADYSQPAWNNLGTAGIITSGYDQYEGGININSYNYFHNIVLATACGSGRIAVMATVNPAPDITLTATNLSICSGNNSQLSVTSTNDPNYNYSWTSVPAGFTATGSGPFTVSPTVTTTYHIYAMDNSAGAYSGCAGTASVSVTVSPNYILATALATPSAVCAGSNTQLTSAVQLNYCEAGADYPGFSEGVEYISNFSFNTINNSSDAPTSGNQYTDYTAVSTNVVTGSTYTAAVLNPYWYDFDQAAVWIDFNQNGSFEDPGEYFALTTGGGNGSTPLSGNIAIPLNAYNGSTRIRVRYNYAEQMLACGISSYGEVEDYSVIISGGVNVPHNYSFDWSANPTFLNATNISNPVAVAVNAAQNYTVNVTDINTGCVATAQVSVTVNPLPAVTITPAGPVALCTDGSVLLTAVLSPVPPGTNTYQWNLDGSPITAATSNTYTAMAAGNYSVSVTSSLGCTGISLPVTVTVSSCNSIAVNLKLFLQGYYMENGIMQPVLSNQGVAAFPNETDTIVVELHHSESFELVDSKQAVLLTDGTVSVSFIQPEGLYYIAVKHRNTIQTWSANAVACTANTALYDFSIDPAKAMGNNEVLLEEGIWGMYVGDINQDEYVDAFDYSSYNDDNLAGVNGVYVATDMNGDGYVDAFDYSQYNDNNLAGVQAIHP